MVAGMHLQEVFNILIDAEHGCDDGLLITLPTLVNIKPKQFLKTTSQIRIASESNAYHAIWLLLKKPALPTRPLN